ncbi:GAF domain-containing protein [Pustulibacterium marinum]|uniref:histidine kinase n=1 Tax=Pustulibacterium marinum TaxID=1224947 RepID=A0A1I7ID39_9FLAO|nr:GAF domain-containing sensor histidine kinase [Pustulibacterium marinum]SFU70854.1 GAF domain-containing protein [Pustulibacterium marinum]
MKPAVKILENLRLKDVKRLQILDTLPEKDLDDITKLASQICGTPVSLISIIDKDRQWFKSKFGVDFSETSRDLAYCNHAIKNPAEILEVENALEDDRFKDNPLAHGKNPVIAYTGIPLVSDRGYAIGTLCTIDHKPKKLSKEQKESLRILATQVVRLFELRKANIDLNNASREAKKRYDELELFAGVVSHDMKSPLANIVLTIDTLKKKMELSNIQDGSIDTYFSYLKNSAQSMSAYIEGMLQYYKSDHSSHDEVKKIKLRSYLKKIIGMLDVDNSYEIKLPPKGTVVHLNKTALGQILLNIIANSIKYCDKNTPIVKIDYLEKVESYVFVISDNGIGIKPENQNKIFELFNNLDSLDRFGQKGTGIGLATVKKIVDGLDGTISVSSEVGVGTTFTVSLPKPYEMIVVQ